LLGNTTIGTAELNLDTLITMDNERIKKSLKNASNNLETNAQKVTNTSSSTDTFTVLPAMTNAGETYASAVTNAAASTVKARKTDASANTGKDVEAEATENTDKAGKTDSVANTDKDVEPDATENTDKAGKTDAVSDTFPATETSLDNDVRLATSATGTTKSSLF
jgi:hypothetical protein